MKNLFLYTHFDICCKIKHCEIGPGLVGRIDHLFLSNIFLKADDATSGVGSGSITTTQPILRNKVSGCYLLVDKGMCQYIVATRTATHL